MPYYLVADARFSFSTDPLPSKCQVRVYDVSLPRAKSTRDKPRRARSGSITASSLNSYPSSPINRFTQSMGPEKTKFPKENDWTRQTTPAVACGRHGDFYFTDSWDVSYSAKSNRRSVWQRFTENVDKCVFRVVSKFYK
ncbi:hypothetical protein PRNP1_009670 [Phytophthora ramorum]